MDRFDVDVREINDMIGTTVVSLAVVGTVLSWILYSLGRAY